LTANEHRFLYGFTRELNRVLARAAADACGVPEVGSWL
jgi:hypothetical protein